MDAKDHFDFFELDENDKELLAGRKEQFRKEYEKKRHFTAMIFLISILILLTTVMVSFMLGRYAVTPGEVIGILFGKWLPMEKTWEDVKETIVLSVRVPRVLAAIAVGGSLSVGGAAYQGLFKNPMVSPDLLGASAGASVGACLMMLLNQSQAVIQAAAFGFGMLAVGLTYTLSRKIGRGHNMTLLLVLCGMTVQTLFQAFVSITKYLADTESQLPEITYWLMGSIAKVSYDDLVFFTLPFLIGVVPLMLMRWKLNLLTFGDDEAKALGINVSRIRLISIFCATMLTAAVVSVAGTIGWVGLMIPHLVRFLTGPDNKTLLPLSMIMGATFMLIVDNVCRTLLAYEIPLGILTSLLGAPFFIFILFRGRGNE